MRRGRKRQKEFLSLLKFKETRKHFNSFVLEMRVRERERVRGGEGAKFFLNFNMKRRCSQPPPSSLVHAVLEGSVPWEKTTYQSVYYRSLHITLSTIWLTHISSNVYYIKTGKISRFFALISCSKFFGKVWLAFKTFCEIE